MGCLRYGWTGEAVSGFGGERQGVYACRGWTSMVANEEVYGTSWHICVSAAQKPLSGVGLTWGAESRDDIAKRRTGRLQCPSDVSGPRKTPFRPVFHPVLSPHRPVNKLTRDAASVGPGRGPYDNNTLIRDDVFAIGLAGPVYTIMVCARLLARRSPVCLVMGSWNIKVNITQHLHHHHQQPSSPKDPLLHSPVSLDHHEAHLPHRLLRRRPGSALCSPLRPCLHQPRRPQRVAQRHRRRPPRLPLRRRVHHKVPLPPQHPPQRHPARRLFLCPRRPLGRNHPHLQSAAPSPPRNNSRPPPPVPPPC